MKVTWLGQAGLLFETSDTIIMVDPYLSNSVAKINPHNERRVPVDERFLKVKPDILVFTHNHLDHYDPETIANYLGDHTSVTVLAPYSVWNEVRQFVGQQNNYVLFNVGTRWTEGEVRFTAVKAEHSDKYAIGVVMEVEDTTYYITGDTLYHEKIFDGLPKKIDYVFLPVNGKGNNMNMIDAKAFCERVGAKAVPLHCGLFDDIDMNDFNYQEKVVPEFFKEIKLF